MSYYIVKVYGLVCDVCDVATEENVPKIDEPHKLAATRRRLSGSPSGWVYRDGKDVCGKCAARDAA